MILPHFNINKRASQKNILKTVSAACALSIIIKIGYIFLYGFSLLLLLLFENGFVHQVTVLGPLCMKLSKNTQQNV